ncbi:NfeD family protein [Janibacter corallicola]|uniref:NfeD family protein n=1 Tax=Janibacter corallicola TaxID=415212 RepID=UPI000833E5A5|nr:NfeD family protein [Janibacter corallicola]
MAGTPGRSGPGPFEDPGDVPGDLLAWLAEELGIGWGLLVGLVLPLLVLLVIGLALTVWFWRRYARSPSRSTGVDVLPGQVATVRSADGESGQVFVEGSWWSARSATPLRVGQRVRITSVERLELLVEPVASPREKEES